MADADVNKHDGLVVRETKPRRKAKDNPWYRLATLHGEPSYVHDEIAAKNRVAWNRWMASRLTDDVRASLLGKSSLLGKRWTAEELTPYPDDQLRTIAAKIGSSISAVVDFTDTDFEGAAFFVGFVFSGYANFNRAAFSGHAYFSEATFSGPADFGRVTFSRDRNANFVGATFSREAIFAGATFGGRAYFMGATFSGETYFTPTYFSGATFSGETHFSRTTFGGDAYFVGATFSGDVSFTDAAMQGVTGFDDVKFSSPPQCYNTKLHEGTTWHGVQWPETPHGVYRARQFIDAYERLKLEMDKLKKHGDELDFFALEQQCRRVADGFLIGLPIAVYGFVSDYGRSYMRPLLLLVQIVLVGAIPLLVAPMRIGDSDFFRRSSAAEAVGISFANTLSILGKPLVEPDVLLGLPNWLKALATLQTILGIVLLFLFGLGIRNRFRMK